MSDDAEYEESRLTMNEPTRVALITGGSRGLGREMALELAQRGLRVCLTYRSQEQMADDVVKAALATGAPDAFALRFDQATDDATAVVDALLQRWERLDSLVLNAGIWLGGRIGELDPADWWRVIEVDLGGVYRMARAALPAVERADGGSVTIISSMVGVTGFAGDTAYASAKAGLIGFTKSLAKETGRSGTRVNALAPGFVESDANANVSSRSRERMLKGTLLGRFGEAREIAKAVAFLSEDATYTTGAVLMADGGFSV